MMQRNLPIKQSTLKTDLGNGWSQLLAPHEAVLVRVRRQSRGWIYEVCGLPAEMLDAGAIEPVMLERTNGRGLQDRAGYRYIVSMRGGGRWLVTRYFGDSTEALHALPGVPAGFETEALEPESDPRPIGARGPQLQLVVNADDRAARVLH